MSDDRGLVLTNGRAPSNKKGDLVTQKQVEAFVENFANTILLPHVDAMLQHYMKQIPELVATMLADALKANGMEMKGPQTVAPIVPESCICGGEPELKEFGDGLYYVQCKQCLDVERGAHKSVAEATRAWNACMVRQRDANGHPIPPGATPE